MVAVEEEGRVVVVRIGVEFVVVAATSFVVSNVGVGVADGVGVAPKDVVSEVG